MSLSTNRQFGNCGLINCGNSFVSFENSITGIAFSRMVDVLDTFVCCNSNNDLYDTGAELFAGIRCVFNRYNLAFFSSFRGSNIGNSCICHFIFIFPGYNTNKFNDQLPVTWLADANWLEPCLGIAVRG